MAQPPLASFVVTITPWIIIVISTRIRRGFGIWLGFQTNNRAEVAVPRTAGGEAELPPPHEGAQDACHAFMRKVHILTVLFHSFHYFRPGDWSGM